MSLCTVFITSLAEKICDIPWHNMRHSVLKYSSLYSLHNHIYLSISKLPLLIVYITSHPDTKGQNITSYIMKKSLQQRTLPISHLTIILWGKRV